MNHFPYLALLSNFGAGEMILIFLIMLLVAVPVAIVLLVVFLSNKNKSSNPTQQPQAPTNPVDEKPNVCQHCGTARTNPPANFCPNCGKPVMSA